MATSMALLLSWHGAPPRINTVTGRKREVGPKDVYSCQDHETHRPPTNFPLSRMISAGETYLLMNMRIYIISLSFKVRLDFFLRARFIYYICNYIRCGILNQRKFYICLRFPNAPRWKRFQTQKSEISLSRSPPLPNRSQARRLFLFLSRSRFVLVPWLTCGHEIPPCSSSSAMRGLALSAIAPPFLWQQPW